MFGITRLRCMSAIIRFVDELEPGRGALLPNARRVTTSAAHILGDCAIRGDDDDGRCVREEDEDTAAAMTEERCR